MREASLNCQGPGKFGVTFESFQDDVKSEGNWRRIGIFGVGNLSATPNLLEAKIQCSFLVLSDTAFIKLFPLTFQTKKMRKEIGLREEKFLLIHFSDTYTVLFSW